MLTASPPIGDSAATPAQAQHLPAWPANLLPFLIVAVAAVLRLLRLNLAEYRGDDDDMVTAAYQALHHGWLQAHGLISSVPIDNGPVAMWLLMLPLFVTSSLLVAQVWVALLNIGAVALCYHVVRTTWNGTLALIATVLYAVSPWAVIYSRRLWITSFDAPLAILAFWLLLRWMRLAGPLAGPIPPRAGRRPEAQGNLIAFPAERIAASGADRGTLDRAAVLCGLAFSAFFQAHVVPMGEILTLVLVGVLFFRLLGTRQLLLGGGVLAVTMAPYVITTVIPALGRSVAIQQARHPAVSLSSWYDFGSLVTGRGYQSIAPQGSRVLDMTALPFTVIDWLAMICLVVGIAVTMWRVARARRRADVFVARDTALLLWALIPPLALMVPLVQIHPYYFVVSMPAIYILEAVGLWKIVRLLTLTRHRIATAVAAGLTGVLVLAQLAAATPFFRVLPEFWSGADYGLPLQTTERLAAQAHALASGTLAVVGGFDHDVDYTLYSTLEREFAGARYADNRGILEYALAGPGLVYVTTDERAWETALLHRNVPTSQTTVVRLPGEGQTFRFFRPSAGAVRAVVRQLAPPLATPSPFADIAELDGAAVQPASPGGAAQVLLNWRLLRDPPQPLLMRLELTGTDGYIWTSTEAVSYPAGYWHPGDAGRIAFLNTIDLALPSYLPPGHYEVNVRLLGIADGKQFGAPLAAGRLTVPTSTLGTAEAESRTIPALPHATATRLSPGLTLAGWRLDRTRVQQNDVLGAVLFWRVTGPVTQLPALQLRGVDGTLVMATDASELADAVPASQWPNGALLADRHLLHIDGRAQPGIATLTLAATGGAAVPLGTVSVVSLPRTTAVPPLAHQADATFGGIIRLVGYQIEPVPAAAGSPVRLTLIWQALGLPRTDETVFVHLLDADNQTVAQADAPPGGTAAPTSTWEPGQVITDIHTLNLPPSLAAGSYRVQIGVYNVQTGSRLPATGAGIAPNRDYVDLGTVQVKPA